MLDFGSYYRDPFDTESIEVLKGPSATLFGRGSTGGVINEVAKQARLNAVASGTLSFGTDDTKRAVIDVGRGTDAVGGAAFRLNAMVNEAGFAGIHNAETRRYGIAPSLAFGLNGATQLRLDYLRQQSDDTQYYGIPWLNGRPADVCHANFYGYPDDFLRSTVDIGTIRLEHEFSAKFELHDQIRYSSIVVSQRAVEPELLGYTGATDIVPAAVPLSALQISRNVLALRGPSSLLDNQTEGTARFNTGPLHHALVFGLEEQRQTSDITRLTYPQTETSLLDPRQIAFTLPETLKSMGGSVNNDLAPYINDSISLGARWIILGGWRRDHYSTDFDQILPVTKVSRTDDKPSWRGAVVYKPAANGSIYFSYGSSFDPSGEAISLTAATATLAPETSTSTEVGTKWDVGRLTLSSALYQIRMNNVREVDPNNPTADILAGAYRARGFELSLTGHLTRRWEIFGGYSYNDAVVVSSPNPLEIGNNPPNAPKHTLALWTEYHTPLLPLTFGAGVNYVSSRTASSLPVSATTVIERAPGYTTLQLMAKYNITRKISAQVNISNATDIYYYSALHPTHIVLGASRAALFSLSASL